MAKVRSRPTETEHWTAIKGVRVVAKCVRAFNTIATIMASALSTLHALLVLNLWEKILKTFSERAGFLSENLSEEIERGVQAPMTKILRTLLWNVVVSKLFGKLSANSYGLITQDYHIFINLWRHFFKLPMDEFDKQLGERRDTFRDFFEVAEWNRIYDFFEFVAQKMTPFDAQEWIQEANEALAEGDSYYRFIGSQLVPVSENGNSTFLNQTLELFENQGLDAMKKCYEAALRALRPFNETKQVSDLVAFSNGLAAMLGELSAFLSSTSGTPALNSQKALQALRDSLQASALQFSSASKSFFAALIDYLDQSLENIKNSIEAAKDATGVEIHSSELVYLLGQGALLANLVFERLFELSIVERKPAKVHKPAIQDPWGERRLGK